jgi:hypothetical protein
MGMSASHFNGIPDKESMKFLPTTCFLNRSTLVTRSRRDTKPKTNSKNNTPETELNDKDDVLFKRREKDNYNQIIGVVMLLTSNQTPHLAWSFVQHLQHYPVNSTREEASSMGVRGWWGGESDE